MDQDLGVNRRSLGIVTALWALVLVILALVLVPWEPLGYPAAVPPVTEPFPAEDVARSRALTAELGPWGAMSWVVRSVVLLAVATAASHRLLRRAGTAPARRRSVVMLDVVLGALAATVASTLASLPVALRNALVLRRHGILTQPWGGWWRDLVVSTSLSALVAATSLVLLWWLHARAPRTWPYWLAAVGGACVLVASLVWPVVVSPLFEDAHPLPEGPLRSRIEKMAQEQGLGHPQVLVTDASARTSTYNASVSGFGPSRTVTLYDTLVRRAEQDPDAVMTVVAHEMGHAARQDVLRGTTLGAGAAALLALVAGLVLGGPRQAEVLRRSSRARGSTVALAAATVLAVQVAQLAATPPANLVSRRIEARADVYALDATRDPAAFERMWVEMARAGRSRMDPSPWWRLALYETHPSAPWRIGQERTWAREHPAHP